MPRTSSLRLCKSFECHRHKKAQDDVPFILFEASPNAQPEINTPLLRLYRISCSLGGSGYTTCGGVFDCFSPSGKILAKFRIKDKAKNASFPNVSRSRRSGHPNAKLRIIFEKTSPVMCFLFGSVTICLTICGNIHNTVS